MARKFFYVCAGMFLIALSYHLGARDAAGQSNPGVQAFSNESGGMFAVVDGSYIQFDPHSGGRFVTLPLPVSGPVVGTGNFVVVYRTGDVYVHEGGAATGAWVLKGNLHAAK